MAISSYIRNFLLILALVGVLALGVNSCAAPEEAATDAEATATSSDSSDNTTLSDNTSSSDNTSVATSQDVRLSGYFQKGPFVQGTEITVRELDRKLIPTGRNFTGTIEDNTGSFNIKGRLRHPFVEMSADGFYFNEVTGSLSSAKLTLKAFSHIGLVNSHEVNVNLIVQPPFFGPVSKLV